ncbi:hypothetical protein ACM66Z_00615 [Sulfurovum sp. ST-21]|uniref:Uncharacterized protein n=1 Tax=Sulfurovum indicum TaxID=2779528 RepID=A0A7M1S4L4_9BACT|nr:hypothetical protein [Sulfurovum indicum]QOR62022.1 hypothetical protein IMZ28_00615 [Sulfurovum indicum]
MANESFSENALEENIWVHGKPVANLASSDCSMSKERKAFIRKALEYDIIDIRTYRGYKGDLLIEVTTMDPKVVQVLKKTAEELGMDTAFTKNILSIYKIYSITPSPGAYALKEDD